MGAALNRIAHRRHSIQKERRVSDCVDSDYGTGAGSRSWVRDDKMWIGQPGLSKDSRRDRASVLEDLIR